MKDKSLQDQRINNERLQQQLEAEIHRQSEKIKGLKKDNDEMRKQIEMKDREIRSLRPQIVNRNPGVPYYFNRLSSSRTMFRINRSLGPGVYSITELTPQMMQDRAHGIVVTAMGDELTAAVLTTAQKASWDYERSKEEEKKSE